MTNNPYGASGPPPSAEPEPSLVGYPPPVPWQQGVTPSVAYPYPPTTGSALSGPPPGYPKPKRSAMPDGPREYQQLLRGPRYHWWRPLLALVLALAIAVPLWLVGILPVILSGVIIGVRSPAQWAFREISKTDDLGPAGFLYVTLTLIALIPAAGLSIWIAHRIRPRYLASVQGRIRWRWLLRCLVVVVPVWAVYLGLSILADPAQTSPRPAHWGLLLVIVVFLIPFQAAGEEYFFRGWILQNVGSWFRKPMVGLILGLTVSVVSFSWAHGSPDIWVLGSLAVFALTAGIATWRTGGLEAGIAIHAVNNIGVFFTVILLGGWQDAFVGANTQGAPLDVLIALIVHGIVLALILWQAKKAGIERRYLPPAAPVASTAPPAYPPYPQPIAGS